MVASACSTAVAAPARYETSTSRWFSAARSRCSFDFWALARALSRSRSASATSERARSSAAFHVASASAMRALASRRLASRRPPSKMFQVRPRPTAQTVLVPVKPVTLAHWYRPKAPTFGR